MLVRRVLQASNRGATRVLGLVPSLVLGLGLGSACAEPLPLPTGDFALKAQLLRGGSMDLSHSSGRMRVEVSRPNMPDTIVGIIDLKASRMVMMMPNIPKMAVEVELPPEYVVGAIAGTGTKIGQSEVADQPCDLWQVDPPARRKITAAVACITPDGIALRTEAEINGQKRALYEVQSLTRGPQDPSRFQLPPGVQVVKVPKGKLGTLLGLPGAAAPAPAPGGPSPAAPGTMPPPAAKPQ